MVDKNIIENAFNKAMSNSYKYKCGIGLMLPKNVITSFNNFHDKFCTNKEKIEHLLVTDKDGNVVYENSGDENSVEFSNVLRYNLYKQHGQLYTTHNHPRVSSDLVIGEVAECLSNPDISNLFDKNYNFSPKQEFMEKSISCESFNGSRMTLTISDEFDVKNSSNCIKLGKQLVEYWQDYDTTYYDTFGDVLNEYSMTDFNNDSDKYIEYCMNKTFEKIGIFEKNPKFKEIQNKYRNVGVKLTYTFPRPYHVGA